MNCVLVEVVQHTAGHHQQQGADYSGSGQGEPLPALKVRDPPGLQKSGAFFCETGQVQEIEIKPFLFLLVCVLNLLIGAAMLAIKFRFTDRTF